MDHYGETIFNLNRGETLGDRKTIEIRLTLN